jgi:hypothetical protein
MLVPDRLTRFNSVIRFPVVIVLVVPLKHQVVSFAADLQQPCKFVLLWPELDRDFSACGCFAALSSSRHFSPSVAQRSTQDISILAMQGCEHAVCLSRQTVSELPAHTVKQLAHNTRKPNVLFSIFMLFQ